MVMDLQVLEVQQNLDHDLWWWICKRHWISRLENVAWKLNGQHQCSIIDVIFFITFILGMYVLNPLPMVYICIVQHSNLQIKCRFSVAFKVFMFLQIFCCCSSFEKKLVLRFFFFEVLLVLWFFFSYQGSFTSMVLQCALCTCLLRCLLCGFIVFLCNFYLYCTA